MDRFEVYKSASINEWWKFFCGLLQIHREARGLLLAQLASSRVDGRPAVRTIVIREWLLNDSDLKPQLIFCTDRASEKLRELERDARAEVCWWLEPAQIQFRFSGRIDLDQGSPIGEAQRVRHWAKLKRATRESFLDPAERASDKLRGLGREEMPPESFVVLRLIVEEFEELDLKTEPHSRCRWRIGSSAWESAAIRP